MSSLITNPFVFLKLGTGTIPIGKISSSCDAGREGHTDTADEVQCSCTRLASTISVQCAALPLPNVVAKLWNVLNVLCRT